MGHKILVTTDNCFSGVAVLTHFPLLVLAKVKIQEKFQITFCQILQDKWYHAKVLPKTIQ